MIQEQKGCKKNNIRAKEEQITAARAKQHEDEEEDAGVRPKETKDKKKTTGGPKNVMQEDQKSCKNSIRAEEEQTSAIRTKQHEDKEEDTGRRPAGREK